MSFIRLRFTTKFARAKYIFVTDNRYIYVVNYWDLIFCCPPVCGHQVNPVSVGISYGFSNVSGSWLQSRNQATSKVLSPRRVSPWYDACNGAWWAEMTTCFGRQLAVASCIWQIRVRRRTYVYIATCDQYLSISRKQYKIWPIWLSKALILYDTDIIDIDIGNVSWPTSTQLNSTNHPKRRVD